MERIIGKIREEVGRHEAPYAIAVSAGSDELLGEPDTLQSCIRRADKKLYLDKEYRKLHRN